MRRSHKRDAGTRAVEGRAGLPEVRDRTASRGNRLADSVASLHHAVGNQHVSRALDPTPALATGERVQRKCADCEEEEREEPIQLFSRDAPGASDAAASAAPAPPAGVRGGWLAEDDAAEVAPGQMRKSEFLAALRDAVCSTANEGMAGTGQTTEACPWLGYWFGEAERRDAAYVEGAIGKFAPEAASAATARDAIPAAAAKVRRSVDRWARTGEVGDLPEGIAPELPGMGGMLGGVAGMFFKGRDGGPSGTPAPGAVRRELGAGTPLDGAARARMEQAFGVDFTRVRIHTGERAAAVSDRLNARAFTVGRDVAFASGEYHPGTMVGDALLAHELAHVVQQGASGSTQGAAPGQERTLEQDANEASVAAVGSIWRRATGNLAATMQHAGPALRSGMRLQACAARPVVKNTADLLGASSSLSAQVSKDLAQRGRETALGTKDQKRKEAIADAEVTTTADVAVALQQLEQFLQEELEDAGDDATRQAAAQQRFEAEVARVRESYALQFEPAARWGIGFTTGRTQTEFSLQTQRIRHQRRHWSREELQTINGILERVPDEYMTGASKRIKKIQREPGDASGAGMSWDEDTGTLRMFDDGFKYPERVERYILHEIGHSTVQERKVGGFQNLPPVEWMRLSDWRTSTWESLGADLGLSGTALQNLQTQLLDQHRVVSGRPKVVVAKGRNIVFDRYQVPPAPPRQFFHYDHARDAQFVSDYARSHPAEDLAESFSFYLTEPDKTQRALDVAPEGREDKWDYLVRNYPHRLKPKKK